MKWRVGDVTVTKIVELEVTGGSRFILPDATREAILPIAWLRPHFADDDGRLRMSIHAFVVETPTRRIVVDTCLGNDKQHRRIPTWNDLHGSFLEDLAGAGYPRESIDTVLCTHLHVDHVGWNTMLKDGKWVPTFPNARYLIGGTEWDYWSHFDGKDMRDPVEDSVRPVVDSGMADLIDSNFRVTDEVWLEPTPGHTPGHHSVRISSQGKEAVITGDLMHHPIQCRYPEWDDAFDSDGAMAKKTRRGFCEKYADTNVLVFGTHFATPSAGKIVKKGDSFRFVAAEG
jgi:glyoxylase-like metal-dependent hydrolase (beta-lactamase superfamily II)